MRTFSRLVLVLAIALVAAACGGTVYDNDEAVETIENAAAEAYPDAAPFEVSCDEPPTTVEEGATWGCTATDANGETYEFQLTGIDAEGNVDIQEL